MKNIRIDHSNPYKRSTTVLCDTLCGREGGRLVSSYMVGRRSDGHTRTSHMGTLKGHHSHLSCPTSEVRTLPSAPHVLYVGTVSVCLPLPHLCLPLPHLCVSPLLQVTGIEGNFRRTCMSVMRVLRENKDSVMAVLEAFVYDPLLNWRLMDGQ